MNLGAPLRRILFAGPNINGRWGCESRPRPRPAFRRSLISEKDKGRSRDVDLDTLQYDLRVKRNFPTPPSTASLAASRGPIACIEQQVP